MGLTSERLKNIEVRNVLLLTLKMHELLSEHMFRQTDKGRVLIQS
jgi:hypothetical protein